MNNAQGDLGETIFKLAISRHYLFRPKELGEKWPTSDFYVELIGPKEKLFFIVQIKSSRQGYSKGKLKLTAPKEKLNQLREYYAPTYLASVVAIRQEYLETAIEWISEGKIEDYMSKHQHGKDAKALWDYFKAVIDWVKIVFTNYRNEMKGVSFGFLYNEFKDKKFDAKKLEKEIAKLMEDEDVTNKKGIYLYVLTRKERFLNIRAFTEKQKREAYERQRGICPVCKKQWKIEEMEGDHITPWHDGGKSISINCQMLCKDDNRIKSGK